jgi:hypothetical protein
MTDGYDPREMLRRNDPLWGAIHDAAHPDLTSPDPSEAAVTEPPDRMRRLATFAKGLVDALYSGVPGQVKPDDDGDLLRYVAEWLDKADDAADAYLAGHGVEAQPRDRSVQGELRRIAAALSAHPSTPVRPDLTLREAALELVDAIDEGRSFTNKVLRVRAALRPCARYALSDGTLCSTHNGRFASPSENRCDRRAEQVERPEPLTDAEWDAVRTNPDPVAALSGVQRPDPTLDEPRRDWSAEQGAR